MRYRLADGVERVEAGGGPALLSRAPLRLVKVNAALARLLASGSEIAARAPAERRALEALHAKGLLAIVEPATGPERLPSVSVVIPVRDRAEELRRCLASLEAVRYPRDRIEVIVVDDGSRDATADVARRAGACVVALGGECGGVGGRAPDIEDGEAGGPPATAGASAAGAAAGSRDATADVARRAGACVVASGGEARGPAAARNRGAAAATGELLAFIDSDCTASEGWLRELVAAFEDRDVVAVGGRVDGMHAASALDRYEAEMSSLCLGGRGRSGAGGDDTFYLPSCNLVVRRRAFAAAGGFREELHVGEDVDLTWRLRDGGGKIVYTPRGRICHEHRSRLGSFLRRRFQYGTSEGLLQTLHPERRKKMVVPLALGAASLLLAAAWLLASPLPLLVAGAVVAADAARLRRRLRRAGLALSARAVAWARLKAWGSLGYYVSFHLTRYYGVPLAVAGIAWPRLGLLLAAMAVGAAAVDHAVRRPALGLAPFLLYYLAEHAAYGAGVFCGCLRQRTFASYVPTFSTREPT